MVEAGSFPWGNGKFPGMTEPSPGYHGVIFTRPSATSASRCARAWRRFAWYGAALSPTAAWQILQGIETLPLRMERHCTNARKVADFRAPTRA